MRNRTLVATDWMKVKLFGRYVLYYWSGSFLSSLVTFHCKQGCQQRVNAFETAIHYLITLKTRTQTIIENYISLVILDSIYIL